jgi:uncharacterized membrane protein (UPF0182 family)
MIERDPAEPTPVPVRRMSVGRRILILSLIGLVVLLFSLRWLATFWTDYLWFDSLGFSSVWTTRVVTGLVLAIIGTAVAFGLLLGNLWLADRLSPPKLLAGGGPDAEMIERFQRWREPRVWKLRLLVAGVFGLLLGIGVGAWWEHWLLFANAGPWGRTDPVFNTDISFLAFRLPFYRDLFGWAFQFVLMTTLLVAAVHYFNGGIRAQGGRLRVASGVKVHLSVLLAILALLKAVGYWLDRFDLLYSERGAVSGASYTDVKAQLPALQLLFFISIVAAVLLLVNIRIRGWILPAAAVGLWFITSLGLGWAWPALVQRFSVQPDEINKELPYIERQIEYTRTAMGIDDVQIRGFAASEALTAEDLANNPGTIRNIRLWDPSELKPTYQQRQQLLPFFQFEDVDVDRYVIDGELTQVMLSGRELEDTSEVIEGWVNDHLVYTHGYGAVVSLANNVTDEGAPVYLIRDITLGDSVPEPLVIEQPRIYFGEAADSGRFKVVGTQESEVDRPLETGDENTVEYHSYQGSGGVEVGGFFRRAAFALRFADINTLISGQITGDSRVLMVRNLRDRVVKAAPFLYPDADPYLVILDGRLVWVQDLYTVTSHYPYSEAGETERLDSDVLPSGFNYIRNSVKATVDAYDGTITFYVWDEEDPVLRAYRSIFPDLFTDKEEMPQGLLEHLRYPEDLFRVQSDMYTRYHVTDPRVFYNGTENWAIAIDPSGTLEAGARETTGQPTAKPMVPYYLLMKLPDDEEISYVVLQPFTPLDRDIMVSFLVAKSDADEYGELTSYEMPRGSDVDGPAQVSALINQNTEISEQFTLLGQGGSKVVQGNMLVVPIEESILYVQPVYLRAALESGIELPEFRRVVVAFEGRIVMRETLAEALIDVFGESPEVVEPSDGEEPDGGEPVTELDAQVIDLLTQADEAFARADAALRDGDLATYAEEIAEAQRLIGEAVALVEASS